jgi:hypothetical protein
MQYCSLHRGQISLFKDTLRCVIFLSTDSCNCDVCLFIKEIEIVFADDVAVAVFRVMINCDKNGMFLMYSDVELCKSTSVLAWSSHFCYHLRTRHGDSDSIDDVTSEKQSTP